MHKTCTQELIITPVLGGRQPGYPWHYFTRGTEFNGDFINSEHLIISDAEAEKDDKKSPISAKVKLLCGTCSQRIHPKGREAFTTDVLWRTSESCNDEWPHLLTLPDLQDETVADKVLLLRFSSPPFGHWMPEDRNQIKAKIEAELPAFIHYGTPLGAVDHVDWHGSRSRIVDDDVRCWLLCLGQGRIRRHETHAGAEEKQRGGGAGKAER